MIGKRRIHAVTRSYFINRPGERMNEHGEEDQSVQGISSSDGKCSLSCVRGSLRNN